MGRADAEALSHHDYSGNTPLKMQPQTTNTKPTKPNATKEKDTSNRQLGQRKFHLE
jgi:hypothetical protein